MNMNTTTQPERAGENANGGGSPTGPGTQLRQARLDLKLAPEDVAHILHLSPRQIVALENDEYDKLPGPTYVRGYLRGYAQLLGLAAEQVVESYNRLVTARKPVDLGKLSPQPEISSDHQLIKFATLGVVVLVIGLSAIWWREQDKPAPKAPIVEQTKSTAEEQPMQPDEPTGPASTMPPVTASPAPALPAPVARNQTPVAPVPAPVPAKPPVAVPNTEQKTVVPSNPPNVASIPADMRGRIVMQTQVESWADIRDAQGNRLLYDVVPGGRTITVEGAIPLSVFLGNVEGLKLEFNGQAFDVSRYRHGDVARFTLGEAKPKPAETH